MAKCYSPAIRVQKKQDNKTGCTIIIYAVTFSNRENYYLTIQNVLVIDCNLFRQMTDNLSHIILQIRSTLLIEWYNSNFTARHKSKCFWHFELFSSIAGFHRSNPFKV